MMRFQQVFLEAIGYAIPDEIVATSAIESRLTPLYERLRLPAGRLELMTGIRERRFFPRGTLPSAVSTVSASRALQASQIDASRIGALVHGSVCRDYLEPATACGVHHALKLSSRCHVYDISNACLGLLTGTLQIATMIEAGQIEAGIVVGSELGGPLVEATIAHLNADQSLTRQAIKPYFASLTIGSASAAILLCNARLSQSRSRLLGAATMCNTTAHQLCQSDGLSEFMRTDSEQLLHVGVATAVETFALLLDEMEWTRENIRQTIGHQVGSAHRKLLLDALNLPEAADFTSFETLGNTGAAALPTTLALAAQAERLHGGDLVALLGIGSGINCQMLGVEWGETRVEGGPLSWNRE